MYLSRAIKMLALSCTLLLPLTAIADITILVGTDPADEAEGNLGFLALPPSLQDALGKKVIHKQTSNLTDVMRASRTQENDILVGPPHVTASAISHGYRLLARDTNNTTYVLVARKEIGSVGQLAGKRLYLTQEDSARAYLAKGMLTDANVSLKSFKQVVHGRTSGAGLLAIKMNLTDLTIAEQTEAERWMKSNPDIAIILKSTRQVPAGTAMMVRKGWPESERKSLLKWLGSTDAKLGGYGKLQAATASDEEQYRYIASLGILTPTDVQGATVVSAAEVAKLIASGVAVIDTRSLKEFEHEHITGAMHAPYIERSLKERDFDRALDDYSAITKLPKDKPLIFLCNGPECWKSYKASRIANENGYKNVYWYRGGMPDWHEKSMPTVGTVLALK
jgi:rhodanese-related sulfurtransferase